MSASIIRDEHASMETYPMSDIPTTTQARQRFRWFAIGLSLLLLTLTPAISPSAINWAIVACVALCLWDSRASLFLLVASVSAYSTHLESFSITPTRVVGMLLMLRCLISPGISGITGGLGRLSFPAKVFLPVYMIAVLFASVLAGHFWIFAFFLGSFVIFVIACALLTRIDDPKDIVLVIVAGLLLAALNYIPVWTGNVAPVLTTFRSGRVFEEAFTRVGAGRWSVNFTAGLLACGFASFIFMSLTVASKSKRLFAFALAVFMFVALVNTGSRAGIVSSVLGLSLALLLSLKVKGMQVGGKTISLLLVSAVAGMLLWGILGARLTATIGAFGGDGGGIASGRAQLWVNAVKHLAIHPIPNPGAWWRGSDVAGHNTYLSAGIAYGWGGFIGFMGLTLGAVIQGWRNLQQRDIHKSMWQSIIFIMLLTLLVNIMAISSAGHKLLWILLAICNIPVMAGVSDHPDAIYPNECNRSAHR